MTLDEILTQYKEPLRSCRNIHDGVDNLEFDVEGYVPITVIHMRTFKEMGRSIKDIDEWLRDNTSGEYSAIVTNKGSQINSLWCFEEMGDAAMFKLTFGV